MQETLYQPADAGVSLSDSGCRRHSIRQRMQKSLYQTADAGDTISDSGCRGLSISQQMQETLLDYQTADAGVSLSDRCLIECLLHPLSDRENSASAV